MGYNGEEMNSGKELCIMLKNIFSKGKLKKIWEMEDVNERIMALSEYVAEK